LGGCGGGRPARSRASQQCSRRRLADARAHSFDPLTSAQVELSVIVMNSIGRRRVLGWFLAALATLSARRSAADPVAERGALQILDSVNVPPDATATQPGSTQSSDFNMVGQYDCDWLVEPEMDMLLDYMAASPGAFGSVRFFHSLDSGTRAKTIDDDPLDGGTVWLDGSSPMDFSRTLNALEALTSRGLVPFIVLNFFPRAVSGHAATPPSSFEAWQRLVRSFLLALINEPRFGSERIRNWRFEVWNEPNNRAFWLGSFNPDYFDLYRATSEAVSAVAPAIQLGGPAMVYKSERPESRQLMAEFLRFLSREPNVKCEFISLHAKGDWTGDGEPNLQSVIDAVVQVADLAIAVDRQRFRGLTVINDEADMRVGFDIPYEPRMQARYASWIWALVASYGELTARYRQHGLRFHASSDNANQQLVRTSFDGRRSIMTRASSDGSDLIKLPVFNAYELLRLLGNENGATLFGGDGLYPHSDVFHVISRSDEQITSVFTAHPRHASEAAQTRTVDYALRDISWERANVVQFRIDALRSNSYRAAAGLQPRLEFLSREEAALVRQEQELAVLEPIGRNISLSGGKLAFRFTLPPYAVHACWITPFSETAPSRPAWIRTALRGGNIVIRWQPATETGFYTFELFRIGPEGQTLLTPVPLRSAIWVDGSASRGTHVYQVRAVSTSGVASAFLTSDPVRAGP
jgi:hypothetical protein